jgi:hypothetical protein
VSGKLLELAISIKGKLDKAYTAAMQKTIFDIKIAHKTKACFYFKYFAKNSPSLSNGISSVLSYKST